MLSTKKQNKTVSNFFSVLIDVVFVLGDVVLVLREAVLAIVTEIGHLFSDKS